MANSKSKVSFSIQLLKMNRKYHEEALKREKKRIKSGISIGLDKEMMKFRKKTLDNHQKYYDDLTLAIDELKKIK